MLVLIWSVFLSADDFWSDKDIDFTSPEALVQVRLDIAKYAPYSDSLVQYVEWMGMEIDELGLDNIHYRILYNYYFYKAILMKSQKWNFLFSNIALNFITTFS